ncbi:response regulator transcription factor [Chryseolinea sp. T2]|uniref:response regulator transcription factor n=1 Tax=Chryseolinea sp. T2 TaxID=3129255 RepID=UPI00307883D6
MKRILLIEDDPTINQNIRDALVREGYDVHVAFDGLLGERILRKEQLDCVVIDLNLPGKNGYDICRDFRKVNTTTPILILTAFDEIDDKVQGYESGADDYLTKPFYMQELVLRIQSLLRRNNNTADSIQGPVTAGDIVVNPITKRVTRGNVEISLTPREYQILLKLISARGEVVSKKDLIEEIWGRNFDANTNTVEVYINFLRKKVDKPFGKDSIRTRVGYGYYLEA